MIKANLQQKIISSIIFTNYYFYQMRNLFFAITVMMLCTSCNDTKPNSAAPAKEYEEACEMPETVIFGYKGRVKATIKHSVTKDKVDGKWVIDKTDAVSISKVFYDENGYPTSNESEFSSGNEQVVLKNVFEYINGKVSAIKNFINDSLDKTYTVVCKGRYEYVTVDIDQDSSKHHFFLDNDNRIIKEVLDLPIGDRSRVKYVNITTYGTDVDTIRNFKDGKMENITLYKILKRDKYGNPIETITETGDMGVFTNTIYEYYN